jgi:hypothetical protein
VDKQEKAPYGFRSIPSFGPLGSSGSLLVIPLLSASLPTADYSLEGWESQVAVERKSLEDLYATLGQHRERFKRAIARLNEYEVGEIVIEATLREVMRPAEFRPGWRSRLDPRSVYGTWQSWKQRYRNVHWTFAGSRRLAEYATFRALACFYLHKEKEPLHVGSATQNG